MYQGYAVLELCEACHQQARLMMDEATEVASVEMKAERLRVATEWLKLATEIGSHGNATAD
jgi:hypothetical protein